MVNLKLIDMLPPSTNRMAEEKVIQKVLSREYNTMSYIQYRIQKNANIPSCDEYGISVFESDMGITPLPTDTLDQRIARCILVWNNFLPYNWASLIRLLDTVIGRGNYTATCEDLMLVITYTSIRISRDELYYRIRERVPAKVGLYVIYRVRKTSMLDMYVAHATGTVKRKVPPIHEGYTLKRSSTTDMYNGLGMLTKIKPQPIAGYSIKKEITTTPFNGFGLLKIKKCEVKE